MNASGSAVVKVVPREESQRLLVVYDDIDLPLGELKVSFGRGAGGHNGVSSIIESLGTKDFVRVRIGIGKKSLFSGTLKRPKGKALSDYVLGRFSSKEEKVLQSVYDAFPKMVKLFVTEGREKLMQEFNQ
jgi:PTH1 family peptidyl-tRNA hydrolase